MDMFGGGIQWKPKINFGKMLEFLDIPTSKDEMDGSQVFDYWLRGDLEPIYRYCPKDVDRLRKAYRKMTGTVQQSLF